MGVQCTVGNFVLAMEFPSNWIISGDCLNGFKHVGTNATTEQTISLHFSLLENEIPLGEPVFLADSKSDFFLQNIWSVHKLNGQLYYLVDYGTQGEISKIIFTVDATKRVVDVFVDLRDKSSQFSFDPFMHPLGVLLIASLQQLYGGLLIHASGIVDGENGYIFTGVSGIGKSTMAGIWQSVGAEIVNDDRLMICESETGFTFHNTPMPHYYDFARSGSLKGIFLLSQSETNHCTKISGIRALSKVMANFMQQLFDAKLVEDHLNKAERLVLNVPVYQLGFKPDTDVVALVRSLNL